MHPNKLKQLNCLRENRKPIDKDWLQWFAGFVDGEGSFTYTTRRGGQKRPVFAIGLNNKDVAILHEIQRVLQLGKIYVHGKERDVYRNGEKIYHASASTLFRIAKWAEMWVFAELLAGLLKTSKENSFSAWHDMVKLIAEHPGQGHHRDAMPDYSQRLALLADKLSIVNRT